MTFPGTPFQNRFRLFTVRLLARRAARGQGVGMLLSTPQGKVWILRRKTDFLRPHFQNRFGLFVFQMLSKDACGWLPESSWARGGHEKRLFFPDGCDSFHFLGIRFPAQTPNFRLRDAGQDGSGTTQPAPLLPWWQAIGQ